MWSVLTCNSSVVSQCGPGRARWKKAFVSHISLLCLNFRRMFLKGNHPSKLFLVFSPPPVVVVPVNPVMTFYVVVLSYADWQEKKMWFKCRRVPHCYWKCCETCRASPSALMLPGGSAAALSTAPVLHQYCTSTGLLVTSKGSALGTLSSL